MRVKSRRAVILLATVAFFLSPISFVWCQKNTKDATRQIEKIPRRVVFRYIGPSSEELEKSNVAPFSESTEEILYTTISSIQPIVKTENLKKAHNLCRIEVEEHKGKEDSSKRLRIVVTLQDTGKDGKKDELLYKNEYEYGREAETYTDFLETAAREMAPKLSLVEPEVKLSSRVESKEEREMVEELNFAERLTRPLALRGRAGNLTMTLTDFENIQNRFQFLPLILDAIWFPGKNHGIIFSFFGDVRDANVAPGTEIFLMPGAGYSYRSLGRIAAGFDLIMYGGNVFGSGISVFYTLTAISPTITYNISPAFGVSLKPASLYISIDSIIGNVKLQNIDMNRNVFFQQILALSFTYRPDI